MNQTYYRGMRVEEYTSQQLGAMADIFQSKNKYIQTPVYNVSGFGAKGDGITDDTDAIQKAVIAANSNGAGEIYFPPGVYAVTQIQLFSNVTFNGDNQATILCLDPDVSDDEATFMSKYPSFDLENIHFRGLKFNGNRQNIGFSFYNIIGFWVSNGRSVKNFSVTNCYFEDAKQDFIRILGAPGSLVENVTVSNCQFIGVNSTLNDYSMNGVRFFITGDYTTNYGTVFARNIEISECYAENIRTLADIKRGCANFHVHHCISKNMHDIDVSVDGSFFGQIDHIITRQDDGFVPVAGDNAIEIQGENITVSDCVIENKKTCGVSVTDYGRPEEGTVGHRSLNIKISGCVIKKVGVIGIKIANADGFSIVDNDIYETTTSGHPVAVDSGTGRTNSGGTPLIAENGFINGNRAPLTGNLGYSIKGTNMNFGPANTAIDGRSPKVYYIPGSTPTFQAYVLGSGIEYNLNTDLTLDGSGFIDLWNTGFSPLTTVTPPPGVNNAVQVEDNSAESLGNVAYSRKIRASLGDVIHWGYWIKKGTANGFSILVQEYTDADGFISSNFYGLTTVPTNWTRLRGNHVIASATCSYVVMAIVPAASGNFPTATGTNQIALLNISNYPVN